MSATTSLYNPDLFIPPYEIQGEHYIQPVKAENTTKSYLFAKRLMDVLLSIIALIFALLPMLIIAIVVKLDSPGPVLFRQERLGLNGKPFLMLKFRSMYMDAEKNGAQWAASGTDERVTKVGRFLRDSRLDELPQLFQVLTGEMSLVGPRPERKVFYDYFETYIHGFSERLKVKPGITGWAQVNGGYELRPEEKIQYDVEYIKKRTLKMEFQILLKTVAVVFTCKDAR